MRTTIARGTIKAGIRNIGVGRFGVLGNMCPINQPVNEPDATALQYH